MSHTTPHSLPAVRGRPARPADRRRARAALTLGLGAATLVACGKDPLESASIYNADTVEVVPIVAYPYSTAATPLPTALSLTGIQPVRPAVVAATLGSGAVALVPNFDFAVDRQSDGRVRFVPSKLIAGLTTTGVTLRTGLMVVNTPYDSLTLAPNGTYQRDSATVVAAGQTLVAETERASCVGLSRTFVYSKLVVDSVSPTTGGVYMRVRVDPNCGYRSLAAGRPTR